MKLVQNTTDIPDKTVERILCGMRGDDLSCAVKVKNSWKKPYFLGTFYPELKGKVEGPGGKVYELGVGSTGASM